LQQAALHTCGSFIMVCILSMCTVCSCVGRPSDQSYEAMQHAGDCSSCNS
jgi:hypothetical protein